MKPVETTWVSNVSIDFRLVSPWGIGEEDHHFLTICPEALWYSADKAQMVGNLISISMFHKKYLPKN